MEPIRPGAVLAGRYRIEQSLGEGGFASVFRARHVELPSLVVAVKVLKTRHAGNEGMVRRLRREAAALAGLKSRHTLRVHDFGLTDAGVPYFVMEYARP